MTNIDKMGKGGVKDVPDNRDYRSELVMGSVTLPDEYSVRDKISRVENQGSSSSCVGQAFAYYAEVLNNVETGNFIELSPRDIYSLIHLESGGAYIREGAKKLTESGIVLEVDAKSYETGNNPTEAFMRDRSDITDGEEEKGMLYWAKSYVKIQDNSFEAMKQAIYQNYGCVSGAIGNNKNWETAFVKPGEKDWGHAFYCTGWKIIDGIEYIEFVNSWGDNWGDNGYGYISNDYFTAKDLMFSPWTIMDLPNQTYPKMQHKILLLLESARILIEKIKDFLRSRKSKE